MPYLFPPISTSCTVFVSPGSNLTAVPAAMFWKKTPINLSKTVADTAGDKKCIWISQTLFIIIYYYYYLLFIYLFIYLLFIIIIIIIYYYLWISLTLFCALLVLLQLLDHFYSAFKMWLTNFKVNLPWSHRFSFAVKSRDEERERSGERKPLVAGNANLTIMLW